MVLPDNTHSFFVAYLLACCSRITGRLWPKYLSAQKNALDFAAQCRSELHLVPMTPPPGLHYELIYDHTIWSEDREGEILLLKVKTKNSSWSFLFDFENRGVVTFVGADRNYPFSPYQVTFSEDLVGTEVMFKE
jgi:hypothetical protein